MTNPTHQLPMKISTPLSALFTSNNSFRVCVACGSVRGGDAFFARACSWQLPKEFFVSEMVPLLKMESSRQDFLTVVFNVLPLNMCLKLSEDTLQLKNNDKYSLLSEYIWFLNVR